MSAIILVNLESIYKQFVFNEYTFCFANRTICSASFVPLYCMIMSCVADCVADQTPLDLVRCDELRLILAAYQDQVRGVKSLVFNQPINCMRFSFFSEENLVAHF